MQFCPKLLLFFGQNKGSWFWQ